MQGRLACAFPDTPLAVLAAVTAEALDFFSSARIRHYVPVLAFKRASQRLAQRPAEPEAEGG
ncbi:three-helix bundle dimerization domain-containing protein [Streptomyces sp. NPDC048825]|uniref:three-helix bundle dimerization domain-containing protein n=1 Tax=Streptomyces sp. NPDC048825 TaxID=3365592 RepID=UPI003710E41B